MVMNPALYRVLVKHFGEVKIVNEGLERIEDRVPGKRDRVVIQRGESYSVDCPLCGDSKKRLSIGYQWLSRPPLSNRRITHLAHCYNEDCPVRSPEFYSRFLEDLTAAEMGLLDDIEVTPRKVSARTQSGVIPLPEGCVPLHDLEDEHPAVLFLMRKYPAFNTLRTVHYLSRAYGAMFTAEYDQRFPAAQDRIIFPIRQNSVVVAWQGRAIDAEAQPRWYLPPGFIKCFYNIDAVDPYKPVILTEGVTNAICCGPQAVAMFGKQLNTLMCEKLAKRCSTVIVATDPDTFVPDNRKGGRGRVFAQELYTALTEHVACVRMLPWPKDVLELARRHNDGEDVAVPDAADLGFRTMKKLIDEASNA